MSEIGAAIGPAGVVRGVLHACVAIDLGEEIDLPRAKGLVPANYHELPRQARTPPSIGYQPAPLRFVSPGIEIELPELGRTNAAADVTLFDFAAASVALHVPFALDAAALRRTAAALSDPAPLVRAAEAVLRPLHERLLPAIRAPRWSELSEEYLVFQLVPGDSLPSPEELVERHALWLAGLVRLDDATFTEREIAEALRLRLSYGYDDLVVADWAAAVLVEREAEELLETIAFANLQLLELRHIDARLDRQLQTAYEFIHQLARRWLPFWRTHGRPLRVLGELKVEANEMLERTGNVLKLIGDQYVARVYRMLAVRFHLDEWGQSIRRSLGVLEGIYTVVADQSATLRTELLEAIIVLLILVEIVLSLTGH
ncbi:MAG: hypothetical protein WED34_11630 [Planctomycetales bacterium]